MGKYLIQYYLLVYAWNYLWIWCIHQVTFSSLGQNRSSGEAPLFWKEQNTTDHQAKLHYSGKNKHRFRSNKVYNRKGSFEDNLNVCFLEQGSSGNEKGTVLFELRQLFQIQLNMFVFPIGIWNLTSYVIYNYGEYPFMYILPVPNLRFWCHKFDYKFFLCYTRTWLLESSIFRSVLALNLMYVTPNKNFVSERV